MFLKKLFSHNKPKKISVYGIFSNKPTLNSDGSIQDPSSLSLVTFAATKDQAALTIDRLLYFKYFSHFSLWLKNSDQLKPGESPSFYSTTWLDYKQNVISQLKQDDTDDDFYVLRLTYTASEFASLLRIFSHCEPVYLPFERKDEYANYVESNIDDDHLFAFPENIRLVMEEDDDLNSYIVRAFHDLGEFK